MFAIETHELTEQAGAKSRAIEFGRARRAEIVLMARGQWR